MPRMLAAAIALALIGVLVVVGYLVHADTRDEARCKEAKARTAGKSAFDLLKAFGSDLKRPDAARLARDISKAESKLTRGFSKAESRGRCDTVGDAATIGLRVSAFATRAAAEISACLGGPVTDRSGDGSKVVVWFGDSNSVPDSGPGVLYWSWCQQIMGLVPADWEIVCKDPFVIGLATVIPTRDWLDALDQVGEALERVEFDAAVLAYGTVDVLRLATPQEIVAAYQNVAGVLCNAGKTVYIATTPYFWPPEYLGNVVADAVNAALAAALPSIALIDVTTGFGINDYIGGDPFDGIHFNETGQTLRAQRAAERLLANSLP